MKTKTILAVFFALILGLFTSCSDDEKESEEYVITVASVKRIPFIIDHFSPYYVKYEGKSEWRSHSYIGDFNHVEGHEYVIRVREDYDKSMEGMIGGSPYSYHLIEILSSIPKDSENIPLQAGWLTIVTQATGDANYPYYMLNRQTGKLEKIAPIEGFEYEEGYQYELEIKAKYNGVNAPQRYTYQFVKIQNKEKLESTN